MAHSPGTDAAYRSLVIAWIPARKVGYQAFDDPHVVGG